MSETAVERVKELKESLRKSLELSDEPDLHDAVDLIWSSGPRRCGPNLLIKKFENDKVKSIWEKKSSSKEEISDFVSRFIHSFRILKG
jgi:hypothetical protein